MLECKLVTDYSDDDIFDSIENGIKAITPEDYIFIRLRWTSQDDRLYIYIEFEYTSAELIKIPEDYQQKIIDTEMYLDKSLCGGMTEPQIAETPFIFIEHMTEIRSLSRILDHGGIDHRLSLGSVGKWAYMGLSDYFEEDIIETDSISLNQFPGVYTRIMSEQRWMVLDQSYIRPGYCILMISLSMLKQQNYHLNYTENGGNINNGTFSVNNMKKYLHMFDWLYKSGKTALGKHHELVFHHKIPIQAIHAVLVKNNSDKIRCQNIIKNYDINLPIAILTDQYRQDLLHH